MFAKKIQLEREQKRPVIAIHGGMGALAGFRCSERLKELIAERYAGDLKRGDAFYPKILFYNDSNTPGRSESIGNESAILKHLLKAHQLFQIAEADFVIAPCNTLMHFREHLNQAGGVEMLDTIKATAELTVKQNPLIKKVGLLSTTATSQHHLYHKAFAAYGIEVITLPEEHLESVDDIIYSLKAGLHIKGDRERLLDKISPCVESLESNGAEAIILGCTELPLLLEHNKTKNQTPVISSIEALCQTAMERLEEIELENKVQSLHARL